MKGKVVVIILLILLGSYLLFINLKDDAHAIEKAVLSSNPAVSSIIHIELLENNKAIAFYKQSIANDTYFGNARLKKNILVGN